MNVSTLPTLLQRFFTDRLIAQLQASPNTIAGYRDTFRLLLRFASQRRNRPPTKLRIEDLDSALIGEFLTHVEKVRHNSARSRNTRLAAIRSFYRYVAMNEPEHALHCQRILAMPSKRYVRRTVDFINRTEMEALLSAPDQSTWIGRRDRTNAACPANRLARLGNDQPAVPRYRARNRRAYQLRRQGTQAALHAASTRYRQDDRGVAQGARGQR
jgi:integrase